MNSDGNLIVVVAIKDMSIFSDDWLLKWISRQTLVLVYNCFIFRRMLTDSLKKCMHQLREGFQPDIHVSQEEALQSPA